MLVVEKPHPGQLPLEFLECEEQLRHACCGQMIASGHARGCRYPCCNELRSLGHLPDCPSRPEGEPSANPFSGMVDQMGEVIP